MNDQLDYQQLDPGIRKTVAYLRGLGFDTTDSGDGKTKVEAIAAGEALPFPHVCILAAPDQLVANCRLLQDLIEHVPGAHVEGSYDSADNVAIITVLDCPDEALFT